MSFFNYITKVTSSLACLATLVTTAGQSQAGEGMQNKIIFVRNGDIYEMNPDGSRQTRLVKNFDGFNPNISPNGRQIVFASNRGAGKIFSAATRTQEIYLMNVDGSKVNCLTNHRYNADANYPMFSPDGKLITFSLHWGNSVIAGDFNSTLQIMKADGTGARGFEVLNSLGDKSEPHFDFPTFSGDSKKIIFQFGSQFVEDGRGWRGDLYTVHTDGRNLRRLDIAIEPKQMPRLSPDGRKVTFVREGEIYSMNTDGSNLKRLTNNPASDFSPLFSPDSQKIVWVSNRARTQKKVNRPDGTFSLSYVPNSDIYLMNIDGSGQKRLTNDSASDFVTQWLR